MPPSRPLDAWSQGDYAVGRDMGRVAAPYRPCPAFLCGRAPHAVFFEDAARRQWLRSLHGRNVVRLLRSGSFRRTVIDSRSHRIRSPFGRWVRRQGRKEKAMSVVADELSEEGSGSDI